MQEQTHHQESKNKKISISIRIQFRGSTCDRLYEQGRQLIILKEEFSKMQQESEIEKIGKPEINEKTLKILETR